MNTIKSYVGLILLSAIWGSSFIFIKLSISSIPPTLLTFYRLLIASIFLLIFLKKIRIKLLLSKNIPLLFGIALFGNVLPFNLISLSEVYLDSIVASVLIGTMPLFTLIISLFFFKNQHLGFLSFLGLVIGFFGMITFMKLTHFSIESTTTKYSLVILLSAFFYGFSANLVKKVDDISPLEIAAGSTILASFLSCPIMIIDLFLINKFEMASLEKISLISFLSATILGVMCTAIAILVFFHLIKIKNAVFASQSNYLIPCFGSFWGFLFLEETLSLNMLYGLFLIVCGGWVVNRSMHNK